MKKLNHFLLLLAIPLSIGCGSKKDEPPAPPPVTYALTVENEKPDYGIVTPIGRTVHNENENVTLTVSVTQPHVALFVGFFNKDNFEYTMPDADATLTAKWKGNLDNMSWQEIRDSNTSSIEVGSVKSILINRKKHAVRVIAKRYDYLDEGQTGCAKYTFQFDHIITKEDGNPYNIAWNTNNTNEDFINSTLNNYLDSNRTGSLFKLFPSDLQEAIIGVYKKVGVFENGKFTISGYSSAKTFPLSVTECSANRPEGAMSNEGELYPYYSGDTSLIRCTVNGSPCAYWTRSPKINTKSEAWCINSNGELGNVGVSSEFSIAPAFCVGWLRIH